MTPTATEHPDARVADKGYAHPDALVSTEWLAAHLDDPSIRVLESDEDVLLYNVGHIRGAQKIDWHIDLNDPLTRDYVDRAHFQTLLRRLGIDETKTVIFYGDKNNWWATYAFWAFQLFGFTNAKILDGGMSKWDAEHREFVEEVPSYPTTAYVAPERDDERIRVFRDAVLDHARAERPLVDVRSPDEFSGKITHMVEYPQEGVLRGGHIPGAVNVPWARATNADGSFKTASELREIYERELGFAPTDDVVTYCRIGERSSHTWFVLTYLLGFDRVRNYDGSWTEWGNGVRMPIERSNVL
jgi:thiosulfate/3-mercaptopyruvate sulfurtransferase